MQLVYLEWHDATCGDNWEEADDAQPEAEEMLCRTVGWVVEDCDRHLNPQGFITVAHTHDHAEDHVRGTITIPVSCITARQNVGYLWLRNTTISTTAPQGSLSE